MLKFKLGCYNKARTRRHMGVEASAPAEDPSHTTDQLRGKVVNSANISS